MSLATQVTALATRVASEIKAVRSEAVSALAGKVSTTRQVLAGVGLTGGGSLAADRTLRQHPALLDELWTDWSTKADGALPAAGDEGAAITVVKGGTGEADPLISGGGVTLAGTGAIYVNQALPSGKKTRRMGAAFTFPTSGSTGGEALALCAWTNVGVNPQTAHIHIPVGRSSWAVQTYNGGATLLASGAFFPALATGVEHRVEVAVYGTTLRVTLPDGTVVEKSDASVGSINGVTASWEILQTSTSATVKIVRTWADSRPDRPATTSEGRVAQIARRAFGMLFYDDTIGTPGSLGNFGFGATPAAWARIFVSGLTASDDFLAVNAAPTLAGHLTRRDWVDRQVSATVTATKTAAYTAVPGELVMVDATSGPITITLPAQSGGGPVKVKKLDASANVVTIQRTGTDTIGTQAATSTTLVTQYQVIELRPSATAGNWAITGGQLSITGLDARYRTPPRTATAGTTYSVDGTVAGNLSLTCTDNTVITPTGTPTHDRMLLVECLASGAARTPSVATSVVMVGVASRSLSLSAAGKVGVFGLRYSALRGAWELIAAGAEA